MKEENVRLTYKDESGWEFAIDGDGDCVGRFIGSTLNPTGARLGPRKNESNEALQRYAAYLATLIPVGASRPEEG